MVINKVGKLNKLALEEAEGRAQSLDSSYVTTKDAGTYATLQALHREIALLRATATRKLLLSQSQRIFQQGERSGRLLAWLAKECSTIAHIANIKDDMGNLLADPAMINDRFAQFYELLYTSKTDYTLSQIDFPVLLEEKKNKLDAPVTLKEVQTAISSLQSAKSPSPDGLPAEFYKTNSESLAPQFHALLISMLEDQCLPPSMSEAVIVVIPKPRKDPKLCESYRPILLLNVDAKIITKILANQFNSVILSLVHGDQTGFMPGFMPGKGTDINLRRLYTNISHAVARGSPGVVASLGAKKAFDSVEWEYLWYVLEKFNIGPKFNSWIKLMYANPTARVRTNGSLSSPFRLHRGTRQGCPLSPGLFTLAIEPLAILIRSSAAAGGMEVGPLREQISLYADDALLYLPDASYSLEETLRIIDLFGSFSGIRINWNKSVLFPICEPPLLPPPHIPLQMVTKFRYLGIEIQKDLSCYLTDNVYPILQQLTRRCLTWKSLPLTPVGRTNLLKMIFLPKFVYVFRNTPVPIPE